jgi:ABC-type uncharacterized transport system fused permease/ATPase subunit
MKIGNYTKLIRLRWFVAYAVIAILTFCYLQKLYSRQYSKKWSYHLTDSICDQQIAYSRQFESFDRKRNRFWHSIDKNNIKSIQQKLKTFVQTIGPQPAVSGRGIIYSSDQKSLRMVYISIKFIRSYGCDLPIQVWYVLTNDGIKMNCLTLIL